MTAGLLTPTAKERIEIDLRQPRKRAWPGDEHSLQKHIVTRAELMRGSLPELARLFAVPNGGHRNKAAAGKMRAEGQKSGVPDLCLPVPSGGRPGLWLELKTATGSIKPAQWDWLTALHRAGYAAHVTNCPETALHLLTDYLEP